MWLLVAATATGPFALHVLVPILPLLGIRLEVSYAAVQLTLTVYLLGVAGAQLLLGPVSDRFGRRPVMLAGMSLYVVAGVICALAINLQMLLAGRLLQAIGGCAGVVVGRAIVRDLLDRGRAASMYGYVTMAMSLAPAVSPAVGAGVEAALGWRAIFVLLSLAGTAVLVAAVYQLNETALHPRANLDLQGAFVRQLELLRSRAFVGYTVNTACTMAAWYAFVAGLPRILVEQLHRPAADYGLFIVLVLAGYVMGNFAAGRWSAQIGSDRMIALGAGVSLVGAAWLVLAAASGAAHPLAYFVPMALNVAGNGISQPNGIAGAVSAGPGATGAAAGLLGFVQMTFCALVTVLVGLLPGDDARPLCALVLCLIVLSVTGFGLAVRPSTHR